MLFTGSGEAFNVGAYLESISPFAWADLGIALCVGFSVVGAAWYDNIPNRAEDVTGWLTATLGVSLLPDRPFLVVVSRPRVFERRT